MEPATRTSEGFPFRCNVCGKKMIVSAAESLGDVTCPHCGVLCFPNVEGSINPSDDEFKLAKKGMFVETNDEGEIVQLYLRGGQYNDRTLDKVLRFQRVPYIDVTFTEISTIGIEKLRSQMWHTIIVSERSE